MADPKQSWFEQSTYIMVHEIGHMFGWPHCPYYECLMNGLNNAEEGRRRETGGALCAICLKKLKLNLQFDTGKRYEELLQLCVEFGFEGEANHYLTLLEKVGQ